MHTARRARALRKYESKQRSLPEEDSGILNAIQKHQTLVVLSGILSINIIGFSFGYSIFSVYGYNYVDHANAGDFFVSAFKSPFIFVYSLLSFFAICLFAYITYLKTRRSYTLFAILVYAIAFLVMLPSLLVSFTTPAVSGPAGGHSFVLGFSDPSILLYKDDPSSTEALSCLQGRIIARSGDFLLVDTLSSSSIRHGVLLNASSIVRVEPSSSGKSCASF